MSKARDWPGGWQMLGPRAVQHLQMLMGGWAQVELTDALSTWWTSVEVRVLKNICQTHQ